MIHGNNALIIDMGMCLRVPMVDSSTNQRFLITPQGTCGKWHCMSPEICSNSTPFDGHAGEMVWRAHQCHISAHIVCYKFDWSSSHSSPSIKSFIQLIFGQQAWSYSSCWQDIHHGKNQQCQMRDSSSCQMDTWFICWRSGKLVYPLMQWTFCRGCFGWTPLIGWVWNKYGHIRGLKRQTRLKYTLT